MDAAFGARPSSRRDSPRIETRSTAPPEADPLKAMRAASHPGRASTVGEIGALPDFDNVTVGIANVAAYLSVLGERLRDELGPPIFPQLVVGVNVCNPDIH